LTTLPLKFGELSKLEKLILEGNPLKSPPPEVVNQGTKAILEYLRKQAEVEGSKQGGAP
jgi:hypothetical protein